MKRAGDGYPATHQAQDNSQESQVFSGEAEYRATMKTGAQSPPAADCATQVPAQAQPQALPAPPPAQPPEACRAPSQRDKTALRSWQLYQIRVF